MTMLSVDEWLSFGMLDRRNPLLEVAKGKSMT